MERPRKMTKKNGRGDWLSDKSTARRALCAKHTVTSGRQWVKLRKALQRARTAAL